MSSPKLSQDEKRRLILPYYAGFSESFVKHCLSDIVPNASSVLDPWNGSGTTTFVCSQLGVQSVGVDVSPIANVIASGRLASKQDLVPLQRLSEKAVGAKLGSAFRINLLDALALILDGEIDRSHGREWYLAPVNSVLLCTAFRVLRRFGKLSTLNNPTWLPRESIKKLWLSPKTITSAVIEEREFIVKAIGEVSPVSLSRIIQARTQDLERVTNDRFDAIITSPPYLTRLDYVRAVQLELEFLSRYVEIEQGELRRAMTGSVLTNKVVGDVPTDWSEQATKILIAIKAHSSKASQTYYHRFYAKYFLDLYDSMRAMKARSKDSSKWIIVVQSSYYKDIFVDLATIVTEMASSIGMEQHTRLDFPQRRSIVHVNTRAAGYRNEFKLQESAIILSAA